MTERRSPQPAQAQEEPRAVKAEPIALDRRHTSAEAFRIIARSCLRQVTANAALIRSGRAPAALHQARVGLRRLRAAIALFRPMLPGGQRKHVVAELRWIARALAPARELDVLLAGAAVPAPGSRTAQQLARSRRRQAAAHAEAAAALGSLRFQQAVVAAHRWIEGGSWQDADAGKARRRRRRPVREHAERVLERRWRRLRRRGRRLARLNPERRHRLRIAAKELRYGVAFFATLFDAKAAPRRQREASDALEALQDRLGAVNDLVVARRLGAEGLGDAQDHAEADRLEAEAVSAWRRFAALRPFWA